MLYPVNLKALRPLTGTYGWPPPEAVTTHVNVGAVFVTDSETALRLEGAGLAERADKMHVPVVTPTPDILEIIQGLKRRMSQPIEAPVFVPENKMVVVEENKAPVKRGRGRPRKIA